MMYESYGPANASANARPEHPTPKPGYGARLDEVLLKSEVLRLEIREMVERANKLDVEKQKLLEALHEQVERRPENG